MAATDLERLVVQLSADIKKYENSLNRARGVTNQRARQIETRFARMSKAINNGAANAATAAGRAFALIGGAQGFKSLSDAATSIDNALKIAGLSGTELERVYRSLFDAATKNAAPIETLVGLYSRLSLVQKELGVSSQQIEGFAGNIALALRVGGVSAQQASGAILGLTQALGNGKVTAEDFGQVLEGAPTILLAAASGIKEAGGSVARLRQLMLDGQLSSKAFFDGIQAGAPVLEQKVAGAVLTIDQRLTNLSTSLINAAREFNQSAKAGETFGNEIDRVSRFLNSMDWDHVIGEIQSIALQLNAAKNAATGFLTEMGRLSGLDNVGAGLVNALGGENGKASFFGGALTIESTKAARALNDLTEKRLSIEKEIADIRAEQSSDAYKRLALEDAEARLAAVNAQVNATPAKIEGGPLDYNRFPPPAAVRTVSPISVSDPQYAVSDSSGKGGRRGRNGGKELDDYAQEIQQIRERTEALKAETEAQAGLNPLVDDYGFAVEKAAAKQDLLTAAKEAGKQVTPELAAQIDTLATAYANAVVASEKLAASQDLIREKAEEARDFNKDLTLGIVQGFTDGKDAADVFADALSKISDRLLDMTLNSIFDSPTKGGAGFNPFGFLADLFREKGGPVRKGQPYIVGERRPEVFVPDQNGTILPKVPSAPTLPSPSRLATASGPAPSFTFAPQIDARGASVEAVARLEQVVEKQQRDFYANVINAVRKGRSSMDLKR